MRPRNGTVPGEETGEQAITERTQQIELFSFSFLFFSYCIAQKQGFCIVRQLKEGLALLTVLVFLSRLTLCKANHEGAFPYDKPGHFIQMYGKA